MTLYHFVVKSFAFCVLDSREARLGYGNNGELYPYSLLFSSSLPAWLRKHTLLVQ